MLLFAHVKTIFIMPKTLGSLSLSTQVQRLIAVTTFLKRLYYFKVINSNFFEYFELPRVPRRLPIDVPDGNELEVVLNQALVNGILGLRDRAILEVYNATGIRRSELAHLDVRDIDFKYQLLNIRKGKGNNDRRVPIAPRALDWLTRYVKELRPELTTFESGNALFVNQSGKRLNNNKLTDLVGSYIRRSGLRDKGACHLFRHATATNMLRGGADIRYVQEMLGHKHITSTQLYTHVAIGDLTKVYKETHPAAKE
jgi:integrase/recombinase XerD